MNDLQRLTIGTDTSLVVVPGTGHNTAVVIMPSGFGITADLPAQMAELGSGASVVVAVDPFGRSGTDVVPYTDMTAVMARLKGFDAARGAADFRAAVAWLRAEHPDDKIIAIGICFGGAYVVNAAADGLVDGVVCWHAGRLDQLVHRAKEITVPMRLHFGSVDPVVPMTAVDTVRTAFADHEDVHVVVHEGATHGFSHPTAPAFNAPAERAAMAAVLELAATISA